MAYQGRSRGGDDYRLVVLLRLFREIDHGFADAESEEVDETGFDGGSSHWDIEYYVLAR